jgi:hypothetical protein
MTDRKPITKNHFLLAILLKLAIPRTGESTISIRLMPVPVEEGVYEVFCLFVQYYCAEVFNPSSIMLQIRTATLRDNTTIIRDLWETCHFHHTPLLSPPYT